MRDKIGLGFVIAATYNAFIVVFSRGFSNELGLIDPLFSGDGCIGIFLWGAAYIALAQRYQVAPLAVLVFAFEKAFYAIHWALWMSKNAEKLSSMIEADFLTGFFYSIYGVGDILFMCFFAWVAWRYRAQFWGPLSGAKNATSSSE